MPKSKSDTGDRRRGDDFMIGQLVSTVESIVANQKQNREDFLAAISDVKNDVSEIKSSAKQTNTTLADHLLEDSKIQSIVVSLAEWRKDRSGEGADKDIKSLKDSRLRIHSIMVVLATAAGFAGHKVSAAAESLKSLFGGS